MLLLRSRVLFAALLTSWTFAACECAPAGEGEGEGEGGLVIAEGEGEGTAGEGEGEGAGGEGEGEGEVGAIVTLQFLTISDWHGQLDPLVVRNATTMQDEQIGGAAALSAYFDAHRAENANTLVLAGGDSFGGSPPLASFFDEEPAVKALNLMGLDYDTFGNHNFDKGLAHLADMVDLADYTFVSSNLTNIESALNSETTVHDAVTPFDIVDVGGVQVAIIGITNDDADTLVFPGRLGTITIDASAQAAEDARAAAASAGADVFIALVHMGATGRDESGNPTGPLIDFAEDVSGFDLIVGDHTDFEVNTTIGGTPVVENRSKGRTYAQILMDFDTDTGAVTGVEATLLSPLASAVTPDSDVVDMLAPYRTQLAGQLDTVIGSATALFDRGNNVERLNEMPIGDLVTDAYRSQCNTQIGLSNGGGIRDKLPSSYVPTNNTLDRTLPDADLVVGDAYAVLPFGNFVVTRTVTGAQLKAALENGFSRLPAADGRFPQVSGIKVTVDPTLAAGSRITSLTLSNDVPIADGTTYTLATTDFVNLGGDGYTALNDGQGTTCALAADVVADYIDSQVNPLTPTNGNRITIGSIPAEGEGEGEGEGEASGDAGNFQDPNEVDETFTAPLAIDPIDDVDCYRFTVPSDGVLTIDVDDGNGGCPADADPEIDLLDAETNIIANDDDGGDALCSHLEADVFANQLLTLCVRSTDVAGFEVVSTGLTVTTSFAAQSPGLIISEVADHMNAAVKFVEIFNATASSVNLADAGAPVTLRIYSNGNVSPSSTIALTGTIAAGQTFVIANSSAAFATAFPGKTANQQNGSCTFNGDDALELAIDAVPVDVYGDIGDDGTGLAWEYTDGGARRNAGITNGRVTFFANQWTIVKNDADASDYTPQAR